MRSLDGKIPFRLLYVEDDPAQQELILTGLEWSGLLRLDVVKVSYLREALELLKEEAFDAVLLDLTLPDATGLDGLEEVLRVSPSTPVVVLSGLDDVELAAAAVRVGAQDYVPKATRLSGDWIARALLLASERKRAARHQHDALARAQNLLEHGERASVDVTYAVQLLCGMDAALQKAEALVRKRDPALHKELRRKMEAEGFCSSRAALWELVSERTLPAKRRKRSISDRALAALKVNPGGHPVQSPALAKQALAEASSSFDSSPWKDWAT